MAPRKTTPATSGTTEVDLKRVRPDLYAPSATEPALVEVPAMPFLMVDGTGDPNSAPAYQHALEALYGVAYTLKFTLKRQMAMDYTVMPLEGLWWTPDMREFDATRKGDWWWTAMIAQPGEVTPALVAAARDEVQRKKPNPALAQLQLETLDEGLAAQILHLGPYATEGPTLARLHAFIREQGYVFDGARQKHHEIYLSDPRRAAPARIRTIVRQPVTRPT